ncbi:MAG: DedA [Candidatus Yanofskybacteria bacterium GW2011_GWA1_41_6]|uniref:DedA n=1 Tax=Candidatus Yanofskybacteria bacterium GW2011_GWA1_41_6 TaxID=1619020 RepID=A0A0G0ZIH3_9BACT|nr:MAG: DedA [Candidatus Yanofskybacteria bacterium GW2011_GWA1_41_6]
MDNFFNFFQSSFPTLIHYKYLFIFLGATIEGMNTTILAGFLASVASISLWPAFFTCLIGEVINGFAWYTVGYYAGAKPIDKWGRKDAKSRKIIEKVEEYFKRYSGRAILFAKVTWSLTIATMITAGSFRYNLKRFAWYNFLGSVIWIGMVFFVGYFFGESYKYLFDYLKNIVFVFVFLGGAIAIGYILKIILRSAYVRTLFVAERLRELSDKVKDGIDKFLSDKED